MNEHLVMPDLMTIDKRREAGDEVAPPMRRDFDVVSPMTLVESVIPTPPAPEDTPLLELSLNGLLLTNNGFVLGLSEP